MRMNGKKSVTFGLEKPFSVFEDKENLCAFVCVCTHVCKYVCVCVCVCLLFSVDRFMGLHI